MFKRAIALAAFVASLSHSQSALALPLSITDVGGLAGNGWLNPLPVADTDIQNQSGQATDTLFFGGKDTGNSGYQFTPVNPVNPIALNTPFLLGDFVHINNFIPTTGITSAQYSFGFTTNGVPGALNTLIQFNHNETNNGGPCAANPITNAPSLSFCDDFVSIAEITLNALITVGADQYYFNLLGLSTDGGATFGQLLQTQEQQNNLASLYGVVTSDPISTVPEPGSLLLLGTGLAAVARGIRRARRRGGEDTRQ